MSSNELKGQLFTTNVTLGAGVYYGDAPANFYKNSSVIVGVKAVGALAGANSGEQNLSVNAFMDYIAVATPPGVPVGPVFGAPAKCKLAVCNTAGNGDTSTYQISWYNNFENGLYPC
jgi:hypothetical protein